MLLSWRINPNYIVRDRNFGVATTYHNAPRRFQGRTAVLSVDVPKTCCRRPWVPTYRPRLLCPWVTTFVPCQHVRILRSVLVTYHHTPPSGAGRRALLAFVVVRPKTHHDKRQASLASHRQPCCSLARDPTGLLCSMQALIPFRAKQTFYIFRRDTGIPTTVSVFYWIRHPP